MFIKIALIVVVAQVFCAEAQITICKKPSACSFQRCKVGEPTQCCADAVKEMCDLVQLNFGFDPAYIYTKIPHNVGKNDTRAGLLNYDISNIHFHGIRSGEYKIDYTNQMCFKNGFELDINYKNVNIYGTIEKGPVAGSYTGHIKNFSLRANLTLSYTDDKTPNVVIYPRSYSIGGYDYKLSARSTVKFMRDDDVDAEKVGTYFLTLVNSVYTEKITKLYQMYYCPTN